MRPIFAIFILSMTLKAQAETFCIAHKGSFKNSPENSLASIEEALALNADGVEFDIRHTKDGEAILMHDLKLTTASDAPGKSCPKWTPIRKLTLNQIRGNCVLKDAKSEHPIPTLEEALTLLVNQDKFAFVELKDRPSEKTKKIMSEFYSAHGPKLRMISFFVKYLDQFDIPGLDLDVAPWGTPKKYGVDVWERLFMLSSRSYRKRESSVWTVNDEKRIRKFLERGVDFITTNEVETCIRLKNSL